MTRLFTDITHYQSSSRGELIDLLKPFVGKSLTEAEIKAQYGDMQYELVDDLSECDIAVLPMSWNYYYDKKLTVQAWDFINRAVGANRKVISYTSGDLGITPKYHKSVYVVRPSGYSNKFPPNHIVCPIFITDPVKLYFNGDAAKVLRSPYKNNTIGFCGLAASSTGRNVKELATVAYMNLQSKLGISPKDLQAFMSTTTFRYRIISKLKADTKLTTNFLLRDKYRAGAATEEQRKNTAVEYFDNMINSDFILCIRGIGNFSVRFYECLAMGRIPVLLNTYSPLPDISPLKWSDYIIEVNENELDQVSEKMTSFLRGKDIMKQREQNRELFTKYLTRPQFWKKSIATILTTN